MIAALLAVTLSWTVPTYTESGALVFPREARIYRHRQSDTWRGMRPAMEALGDVWEAYWPTVRWEARPVLVAVLPLGWPDRGRRMTWTTNSSDTTTFWFVTTVDTAGRESRISNEVGK